MKPLILKDLYTQKLFGYLFPLFLLFPIYVNVMYAVSDFSFVALYVTYAAIWMSVYSNFGTAVLNRREQKLFASFPVTRKMIVQAKYCAAIMWWGIALASYGTLALLISIFMRNTVSFNGITDLIVSLFVTLAAISIFYPLYFLVGYQISAFIAIALPMIIFFILTFISIDHENRGTMLVSIIPTDRPIIIFSIIAACSIISYFSYKLSVIIFEKRKL
ncbi:ABC-2 transporter permease [Bacillus sp. FJAT-49732]|uniref:ABC-2 transporter permease n=1 Tax=Lederbergia citrisecunda TaxID=2833583 RepID=A0A942TKB3_9BACI|nr:ABC-2 transporter permease [Lederbergia citrisecunda]MBS4198316.1 ABC-2 transporter permease [Lederbergia citrisecunda]